MTKTELVNQFRESPESFSELFKNYYKPIFGFILRRTGDIDATADIAADTFLKAFLYHDKFQHRGIPAKFWLYRIATNETNLYFRYLRKRTSLFERLDPEDKKLFARFWHDDRQELEEELKRHRQFLETITQLKTLRVKYQEVISLRYFEGLSVREISTILGIKEGTVKSLLSRGIEKLRIKCNQK